mgnify:CR=1 FL=1
MRATVSGLLVAAVLLRQDSAGGFETRIAPIPGLESFRSIPTHGGAPRFEIKLRIANPNKQDLDIAGISYSVELLGRELISGVTNDVPKIAPYTEEVVTLEAGLQLVELVRLFAGLGREPAEQLEYRFAAKVDFNGFVPTQRVEERGTIQLQ